MTDPMRKLRSALAQISGVPVTAYLPDGGVDLVRTGRLVGRMAAAGIANIMAAGNTGEFYALSVEEIRQVHEASIAAVDGRACVTAAVGRSLVDALELAAAAAAAGADAVMGHHPTDPFAAPSAQADYFLRLADASRLPLVAYVRSDALAVADFVRLAEHANIAGVKFATTNLMLLGEVIRATPHTTTIWVCGLAEGWAPPFYAMGARGFTSGLVNLFPRISLAVHAALEAGDYAAARAQIARIAGFEAMRAKYANGANVTVVKEALELTGEPVGPVRLPGLERLDAADRAVLEAIVASLREPAEEGAEP